MQTSHNRRSNAKLWIAGSGAVAGIAAIAGAQPALAASVLSIKPSPSVQGQVALQRYDFAFEGILGTSMDLTISSANHQDAIECSNRTLCEIERLRAILSTYDPASEISQHQNGSPIQSPELGDLLGAYDLWSTRTGGAIRLNMAGIIRLWKNAASANQLPDSVSIQDARNAKLALNVDALGKGFIIDRAVEVARQYAPAGLLNIGGDIRAWGDVDWRIGIADPRNPSENAPLVGELTLRNSAVATSGGYARYFTVGNRRYSHIIDPRSGWPVDSITSATAIADDAMTANAISTAASVLGGQRGASLAEQFGSGHLLLKESGAMWHGGPITLADVAGSPAPAGASASTTQPADAAANWPKDFQVTVKLALKNLSGGGAGPGPQRGPGGPGGEGFGPGRDGGPGGRGPRGGGRGGAKRPYVAIWVENAQKQVIRTVTIWGNEPRWLNELSYWFQASGDSRIIRSVTRATRGPGEYALTWDGKDDAGKPVAKGDYTIVIELNREHGRHVKETVAIACNDAPATAKVNETAESDASTIAYGPKPEAGATASNQQASNAH